MSSRRGNNANTSARSGGDGGGGGRRRKHDKHPRTVALPASSSSRGGGGGRNGNGRNARGDSASSNSGGVSASIGSRGNGAAAEAGPPPPPPPTPSQPQLVIGGDPTGNFYASDNRHRHQQHDRNYLYNTGSGRRDSTGSSSNALEYSDTSGGEDTSFYYGASGNNDDAGGSALPPSPPSHSERSKFRKLTDTISKSMRVIRMSTSSNEEDSFGGGGDDDDDDLGSPSVVPADDRLQRHVQYQHHSHPRVHRPSVPSAQSSSSPRRGDSSSNWMTQFALSFRSPQWTHHKTTVSASSPFSIKVERQRQRRRQLDDEDDEEDRRNEATPLLKQLQQQQQAKSTTPKVTSVGAKKSTTTEYDRPSGPGNKSRQMFPPPHTSASMSAADEMDYVEVAAAFLMDYEDNRPPSLPVNLTDITQWQLSLHQFRFSRPYGVWLAIAVLCLFGASFLEGIIVVDEERGDSFLDKGDAPQGRVLLTLLNIFSITVFGIDLWIRHELRNVPAAKRKPSYAKMMYGDYFGLNHGLSSSFLSASPIAGGSDASFLSGYPDTYSKTAAFTRPSRSQRIVIPLILFGILLVSENIGRVLLTEPNSSLVLMTSVFKPLILFYVSYKARNALEALSRIIRIVSRVIAMELLLILMFAAVGVRLFNYSQEFETLSRSWLSLFELSTTVVNPSLWMPMYQASHYSACFFVFFVVVSTFYLHSLVLSVVFQTYIHAASVLHERSAADREDDVHLCFLSLVMQQQRQGLGHTQRNNVVDLDLVRRLLTVLRPHYNELKINALMEIVESSALPHHDESGVTRVVDYPTFRTKIRQALNASIRTPRNVTALATSIELLAIVVAIINFIYVILVSSAFEQEWFDKWQETFGIMITVVAAVELLVRFNPLRISDFTPLTRLNTTFDGLALLGAAISSVGIFLRVMGYRAGIKTFDGLGTLDLILFGRAIDMIRIMRFFKVFRDVVRRSADVIPALFGPAVLVFTTVHLFVYLGMAIWGGGIHAGDYEGKITPLYDLNNFNSYSEGIVTMFQILVVNDWHAIAEVFLYADRCSSPMIVYTFFVMANLIGVSIMLNCLTAFFVESFVTKINEDSDEILDTTPNVARREALGIGLDNNSERRSVSRSGNGASRPDRLDSDSDADADSEGSSGSEFLEFDVYEREGFDKIMQTVSCGAHDTNFAQKVCDYLEIFESLAPGRESVGYLICDQMTLERYGNVRFQNMAKGFLEVDDLHVVVTDMHAELLAMASRASSSQRSLIRSFPHSDDTNQVLEISAALIRRHPALSLFVSRVGASHN